MNNSQKELLSWVQEFYPTAVFRSKPLLINPNNALDVNVFIPEIKVAIKLIPLIFNPDEDKKTNLNNMNTANSLGIRILHIFEDEWKENQKQVKSYLKSVINKNEIRLFARKVNLKEVPKEEAKDFLNTYHIQGATKFEIAFGLYHNNELMAVTTGGMHHRQNHEHVFVLNRLAFKENVSIAGGSSRLLKHLIAYAKQQGYSKLLSWSDNRFSEGNVYNNIGFILEDSHGADYSYIKGETRVSKQSCQKKHLMKKGAKGTMEDNTEEELAATLGLYRTWDCGKRAWSIDLTK